MGPSTATIVVALIGALSALAVAWMNSRVRDLERRAREADNALDQCLRERASLRRLVQLIAGAFVGLLPERERLSLLRAIDETIDDEAA